MSSLFLVATCVGCSSSASEVASDPQPQDRVSTANDAASEIGPAATVSSSTKQSPVIDEEAFRMAAYEGNAAIVRQALISGVDVDAADTQQKLTALHMAAYNGHAHIVRILLKNDARVDPLDHEGKSPLTHACTGPFQDTVELLLESGADVNLRESTEGFTPLMMAAGLGQAEVVKVLLKYDADRGIRDQDNDRAIDHARNSGNVEIMQLLGSG